MPDNARRQFAETVISKRREAAPVDIAAEDQPENVMARPGTGQDFMLELRFKDGRATLLDYTYLPRCDYDPDRGIRLAFSTCEVRIEGSNLRGLLEEIRARKRRVIEEETSTARLVKLGHDAAPPFVSRIRIFTDGEEEASGHQQHERPQR